MVTSLEHHMDYTSKNEDRALGGVTVKSDLGASRIAKGYSQEDLAIATGLTISEIVAAEKGFASVDHVERIERVLR